MSTQSRNICLSGNRRLWGSAHLPARQRSQICLLRGTAVEASSPKVRDLGQLQSAKLQGPFTAMVWRRYFSLTIKALPNSHAASEQVCAPTVSKSSSWEKWLRFGNVWPRSIDKYEAGWVCIGIVTLLVFDGCAAPNNGAQIGTYGVLETALMPLTVLEGRGAYPDTRASIQINQAELRISQWNKVIASGELNRILDFIGDGSALKIDWVSRKDVLPDNAQKLDVAMRDYANFLVVIQPVMEFKNAYDTAVQSPTDVNIFALVKMIKYQFGDDPVYASALNNDAIKNLHEGAVFNWAQATNTLDRYNEFLSWYPNGPHAVDAEIAIGTLYANGRSVGQDHKMAANYFKVAANAGSDAAANLLQLEEATIALEADERNKHRTGNVH